MLQPFKSHPCAGKSINVMMHELKVELLIRPPLGHETMSLLEGFPHFNSQNLHTMWYVCLGMARPSLKLLLMVRGELGISKRLGAAHNS